MSSAIYVWPKQPVTLEAWLAFCKEEEIVHSPNTVGGKYFYYGDLDGVEIGFGESKKASDKVPPPVAERIQISTYFMGSARPQVVRIAKAVLRRFPGRYEADQELERTMAQND